MDGLNTIHALGSVGTPAKVLRAAKACNSRKHGGDHKPKMSGSKRHQFFVFCKSYSNTNAALKRRAWG